MRRLALLIFAALAACNAPASENLSTDEQLVASLSTTSYDFGSLQVGQASAPYTVSVNYIGYGSDTVTGVSWSCPDFSITPLPVPYTVYRTCTDPCNTCTTCLQVLCCATETDSWSFDATFTPTVGQTVSCPVTVYLSTAGPKVVTLSGTGTLPPVQIDVQPTSVSFGDVRRNTDSSAVNIAVRNAGGGTMTVSSVDVSAGYTIMSGNTGAHTVGAGASENYSLVCHPTATGQLGGSFNVHSDDPNFPTKSIPLSCNGIDSALAITPSPTTLTTTRVGEPVSANIALQNTGTASMNVEAVSVTGTDITMTSAAPTGTIGAGGSKSLTVGFGATMKETASGTLTVTYDGGQQRTSAISARALSTSMSVTPDGAVDFGPVCAGLTRTQTFTILANDEGPFKVNAVSSPSSTFSVMSPTLPFSIQGSGANKLTFDVTASPAAGGDETAALTLTTDIPNATTHTINLSVTGIPAGVTPNPSALDFGPNTINTTTIGQSVHLSNCSTGPVTFMNAHIEGPDAAEFAIVAQPESPSLSASESATWLVVFQGHTIGPKQASFVVDYDGGTAMVALAGEGTGNQQPTDPGNNPIDERSYYSCSSAGSSAALWPLVLVFLVRRRRRRA